MEGVRMLSDQDRQRLQDLSLCAWATTGQWIDYELIVERWDSSENPLYQTMAQVLLGHEDQAIATLDEALAPLLSEHLRSCFLGLRGILQARANRPMEALGDFTEALKDAPPAACDMLRKELVNDVRSERVLPSNMSMCPFI